MIDLNQVEGKRSGQIPVGFVDRCTLQVTGAQFKISEKSGPAISIEAQIISPESYKAGGVEYTGLDKVPVRLWLALKGDRAVDTRDVYNKLGLPTTIDEENPDLTCWEGLKFDAIVSARTSPRTKPDPENPKKYIPILDGNGQPITKTEWQLWANDVLGPAALNTSGGY